jgi:hypothetical protein
LIARRAGRGWADGVFAAIVVPVVLIVTVACGGRAAQQAGEPASTITSRRLVRNGIVSAVARMSARTAVRPSKTVVFSSANVGSPSLALSASTNSALANSSGPCSRKKRGAIRRG